MKKRKKDFRGQRGIALLFALGMLSLLLILGLAFVTNALVAPEGRSEQQQPQPGEDAGSVGDQPDGS